MRELNRPATCFFQLISFCFCWLLWAEPGARTAEQYCRAADGPRMLRNPIVRGCGGDTNQRAAGRRSGMQGHV